MKETLERWLFYLLPGEEIVCTKRSYWKIRDRLRAFRYSHAVALEILTEQNIKIIRRA